MRLTEKAFAKDGYVFRVPGRRSKKKYDVYKDGEFLVSFGDNSYQQYKDKIGYYKDLDHLDKERRERYYTRFGRSPKYESAMYFSHKYLW